MDLLQLVPGVLWIGASVDMGLLRLLQGHLDETKGHILLLGVLCNRCNVGCCWGWPGTGDMVPEAFGTKESGGEEGPGMVVGVVELDRFGEMDLSGHGDRR